MILTIQTTTFSEYGGIPSYNRLVCRVLNEISEVDKNQVLIATDSAGHAEQASVELPHLRIQAFDKNRPALVRRFMRVALTTTVDVALIGHVNYAPLGWLLKQLQPRVRYGVMLYGIDAWQRLPWSRRRALQGADFFISISNYTKQRAAATNGLLVDRISLLPNALEWPSNPVDCSNLASGAGVNLLSVCRLDQTEQYKGVDKVIEVLPEVTKRVPGLKYVVVGGGTDLTRHKTLAQTTGVADSVRFMGTIDDETLRACYRDCDVFVLPSASEGFGFVFLEAMKFGKPVIAANDGGTPEVVEDGVTGSLVRYGNKQELKQALIDLCLDSSKRQRMGQTGRQRVKEKFTFEHFRETFQGILSRQLQPTRQLMSDWQRSTLP